VFIRALSPGESSFEKIEQSIAGVLRHRIVVSVRNGVTATIDLA
jgi:hypothetical protein